METDIDRNIGKKRCCWWIPLGIFIWPFMWLFPFVTSWNNQYIRIGNDFQIVYFRYKLLLLDHLAHFRIPLWSPSESAGYPFYSDPFAQVFYPLNIGLALFYRLTGGYTVLDHQRFTVLALSILSLGLYKWLRSLQISFRPALFAALIIGMSFKATELLRFPNALHAASWFPWMLYSITSIYRSNNIKTWMLQGFALIFFIICLCTSGYPYYAFYSIFLFGPYLALFFSSKIRARLTGTQNYWKPTAVVALAFVTGLALCAPYILKIRSLVGETVARAGSNFEFSTGHLFGPIDTLGCLVYPPASSFEGWYYFGILALFLVIFFFMGDKKPSAPIGLLVGWFIFITYITYGRNSYLFVLLWNYVPFFSHLQTWARLNVIFIPFLAWLVALSYAHFEEHVMGGENPRRWIRPLTISFGVVYAIQLLFFLTGFENDYWMLHFIDKFAKGLNLPGAQLSQWLKSTFLFSSVGAFLVLFILLRRKSPLNPDRLLKALVVFCTLELVMIGPWVWCARRSEIEPRTVLNQQAVYPASFQTPRIDPYNTVMFDAAYSIGTIWNWHFQRYLDFRGAHKPEEPGFKQLMGMNDAQKVFLSQSIDYQAIQDFLSDSRKFKGTYQVVFYNGDKLVLDVDLPQAGVVSFIDNWDPDWEAAVDDTPAPIKLLFGTFKAVEVPAGAHRVTFTYRPKFSLALARAKKNAGHQ